MKAKLTIYSVLALFLMSCTSGMYLTSGYDDIYYTPSDERSKTVVAERPVNTGSVSETTQAQQYQQEKAYYDESRGLLLW
jgi:hypothetical protein